MTAEHEYDVDAIKQRLVDYVEVEKEIDGQVNRLERIEAKLYGIGSPVISDMPKAHNSSADRYTDMIAKKDELDAEIRETVRQHADERKYIESLLKKIRKSDERNVIRMRYIDGESWNNVNDMIFGEREDFKDKQDAYLRRLFLVHGNALIHLAIAVESEKTN